MDFPVSPGRGSWSELVSTPNYQPLDAACDHATPVCALIRGSRRLSSGQVALYIAINTRLGCATLDSVADPIHASSPAQCRLLPLRRPHYLSAMLTMTKCGKTWMMRSQIFAHRVRSNQNISCNLLMSSKSRN